MSLRMFEHNGVQYVVTIEPVNADTPGHVATHETDDETVVSRFGYSEDDAYELLQAAIIKYAEDLALPRPMGLLCCPFCGAAAAYARTGQSFVQGVGMQWVGTITCTDIECGAGISGNEQGLSYKWNRRVG